MTPALSRTALLAAVVLGLGGGVVARHAMADMSKPVIKAFKAQLIISKGELPEGKTDKDTIAKIKAEKLTSVEGEVNEDVAYWNFHYTAFLTKTGSSKLKMEFYRDGKQFSADKQLGGIDPKSTVLSGDISINEDEGLARGKSYTIKLVTENDVTVASTTLLMK